MVRYSDISELLFALKNDSASFCDVITYIDENFSFTPTLFINGNKTNNLNENNGSAKIFSVALLNSLSKEDTLLLFAEHYKQVVQTSDGFDHENIRNFMQHGWEGISISNNPLVAY